MKLTIEELTLIGILSTVFMGKLGFIVSRLYKNVDTVHRRIDEVNHIIVRRSDLDLVREDMRNLRSDLSKPSNEPDQHRGERVSRKGGGDCK